jgi:eukaryotic-like serine/threonine-protein kinase
MGEALSEEEAEARELVGTTLKEKWRLERLIAIGGMASVYEATHRNGRKGAVKLLHPELCRSGEVKRRFLREGVVANQVVHPGAVAVLDDDVAEDGRPFLVMELLDGRTLDEVVHEAPGGRLDPERVSDIASQLLAVLEVAHARGVVHRDIKPENLLILPSGQLKVLDFGIARLRSPGTAGSTTTQDGVFFGTPLFMAPEQAMGETARIDARTDVWAVGATMFTLLSGTFVHEEDTPAKVLIKAASQPAPKLQSRLPNVPARIAAVVDRALAFAPENRFQTAAEMRSALASGEIAFDIAEPRTAATPAREPKKMAGRHFVVAVLIGLAVAALPITLIVLRAIDRVEPRAPERVVAADPSAAGGATKVETKAEATPVPIVDTAAPVPAASSASASATALPAPQRGAGPRPRQPPSNPSTTPNRPTLN